MLSSKTFVVGEAQKSFEFLETAVGIHWGNKHSRNLKILEEFSVTREVTPGGEEVEGYDQVANGELWNVLFLVTTGPARDLVMDCKPDGRRSLLRLRFEYRAGESHKSVRQLENVLSKACLRDDESPEEQLRDLVRAHRALKGTQPYRNEDMLQRVILQAVDTECYHTLHMSLESKVELGISTTALMHEIVQ